MEKTSYFCDICGAEVSGVDRTVIRPSFWYPPAENIDVCLKCLSALNKAVKEQISLLQSESKINIDDLTNDDH